MTCKDKCSAGATCVIDSVNSSYCLCPPGFMGQSCDEGKIILSISLSYVTRDAIKIFFSKIDDLYV